jgi:hypothetical protein
MCGPQFCSIKIIQDVGKYAAEQGIGDDEAVKTRMEEKSKEFAPAQNFTRRRQLRGAQAASRNQLSNRRQLK